MGTRSISHFPRIYRELNRNRVLYIMIILPLAILVIFKYIPMYGVQIAFREYNIAKGITGGKWVGIKYFHKFWNSYLFGRLIRNTFMINLYSLAVFPLSLVLALLLNYMPSLRFKKTVQMISYAPHFISVVVLCGMITQFLNARTGLVNLILQIFNVPAANYMAKPELFRDIYVWSDVWQNIGYNSIIYIAALSAISTELHEAAIVDGANIIRRIWSIDIPGILPTFSVLLILRCGHLFDIGFEKILLLQNNLNLSVSEVISTYTYNIGLATPNPQYSYAAAIGLFKSLVNMVLLFSVNRLVRQLSGSSLF